MRTIKSQKFNEQQQSNNRVALKYFIGDCITGLNNEYFQDRVAEDATLLAQLVENGKEISNQEFFTVAALTYDIIQKLSQNPTNYKYYYNPDRDVVWYYDIGADVEYFYI